MDLITIYGFNPSLLTYRILFHTSGGNQGILGEFVSFVLLLIF